MPIQECLSKDGKKGSRFGKHGKCYTDEDALEKAIAQGRAIEVSKAKVKDTLHLREAYREEL